MQIFTVPFTGNAPYCVSRRYKKLNLIYKNSQCDIIPRSSTLKCVFFKIDFIHIQDVLVFQINCTRHGTSNQSTNINISDLCFNCLIFHSPQQGQEFALRLHVQTDSGAHIPPPLLSTG